MIRLKGFCSGLITLLFLFFSCTSQRDNALTIYSNQEIPQVVFAVQDLEKSLLSQGLEVQTKPLSEYSTKKEGSSIIIHQTNDETLKEKIEEEGFLIRTDENGKSKHLEVLASDPGGMMYGGLELAEQIRIGGMESVENTHQNPYMPWRGTKFNIPLDARTPTYTDPSDAAQKNIPEMWNIDFWKEYLDQLAKHRYNFVSLWSLHPFPSMVKVPDYPDIALDDVKRSAVAWEENYSLRAIGFDAPEILEHLETIKQITIEEKIEFWKQVMQYAYDRNIRFYVVTWNTFVNGTDGKYGITDDIKNPVTTDYFRKSVKEMFITYPLLAGIGLTTGENMLGASFEERENWAYDTYAKGVLDAAEALPDRKITFIHRQHMTGAKDIMQKFKPLIDHKNIDFIFSFKYAKAHVYSSTHQPYHHGFVEDIEHVKTIWTLRNDDIYHFRWGAPDFVREFIQNIPYDVSRGFYYGSDQYVWGREFMSKEPKSPREIELSKHWYHWMIWGRLGYDPELSDERFVWIIHNRFPDIDANALFMAWQEASMIYPRTTGFHWGALDFQWYIEACKSRPDQAQTKSGFHDVNRFITLPPHPGTDYLSIPQFIENKITETQIKGTSPIEVSDIIHSHANKALGILQDFNVQTNRELLNTLTDIRSMAYLGKYYAHKIRGATELAFYRKTSDRQHQQQAIEELEKGLEYWQLYTENAEIQYTNPLWTNRVGTIDWEKLTEEVINDIAIARRVEK